MWEDVRKSTVNAFRVTGQSFCGGNHAKKRWLPCFQKLPNPSLNLWQILQKMVQRIKVGLRCMFAVHTLNIWLVCSLAASRYTCNTCQMQLLTLILNVGCKLSQIKGHIYTQYHINALQLDSKWSSTTLLMWLNASNAFQKVCCGVTWLNWGTHYFA